MPLKRIKHSEAETKCLRRQCGVCPRKFMDMYQLCRHLKNDHNLEIQIRKYKFSTETAFENWRSKVENEKHFEFVSRGGNKARLRYLYCHRSGKFRSKSECLKAPKQNVTNRIGFDCSAFAVVKFEKGGSVEVTACVDHYGHDNLLSRRKISCNRDIDCIMNQFRKAISQIRERPKSNTDFSESATSMDVNGPQTSDELDYCEKRKNLRSKFLILSNSVDSLSSDQIDEWESVLAGMENSQSQPLSKQSSTAGVVPNKDLQSRHHFSIKKNTDTAKRRLKKYTIENNKSEQ